MRTSATCVVPLALVAAACPAGPVEPRITQDEAITIAAREVSFQPDDVGAVLVRTDGRSVWRVTFRGRLPNQPPGLFETVIVEVDALSGKVMSIART